MSSLTKYIDENAEAEPLLTGRFINDVPPGGIMYDAADVLKKETLENVLSVYSTSLNKSPDDVIIETYRTSKSRVSNTTRNVILAVLNVIFNVGINVSLPIYSGTMDKIHSDAFVLLSQGTIWFVPLFMLMTQFMHYCVDVRINLKPTASFKILFIMGALTTLNGIFVVYASPPDRTPPYLQGLLATMSIPFTVICRIVWLRKGINLPRSLCTGAVMVGLFITAMPQLWGLPGSGTGTGKIEQSMAKRILWPLCFTMGFLPYGIINVICEKELKKGQAGSFSFITWSQIFQLLTLYLMFWTDFIPGFGMADSASDFSDRMHTGWKCLFSVADSCRNLPGKAWLFYIVYCLGNLFQYLLIQYSEGAVYAAVVQACISPLAALFWTIFKYDVDSDHFYWGPQMTETTGFTFVGVCIIVPSVILYNFISIQEEKDKDRDRG